MNPFQNSQQKERPARESEHIVETKEDKRMREKKQREKERREHEYWVLQQMEGFE